MPKSSVFLLVLALFLLGEGKAQFGPGGVGDAASIGLWLRAELIDAANATAVDTWFDVSNYGNHAWGTTASKTPIFITSSAMNNQPVVRFDGADDEMTIFDNDILDNSTGLTFYTALRPSNLNGNPKGIIGKRINQGTSAEYAYTWFFWGGNRLNVDLNTQNNRFNTVSASFSNNTNYALGLDFRGDLPSGRRARVYSQGVKVQESTESSSVLINSNRDVILGALNTNYGNYLGGDFGELIHFNYSLDTTEHILIQNYLAAKFGISLTDNDIYEGDDASNGNHDFDVAGIGRVNANAIHDDAKGTGIIRVLNPSNLENGEFLFWGHNNGNPSATDSSDVPAGVEARLEREWYVSERDASGTAVNVGAVDIRFDLSTYPTATAASDLRLIIDADRDGVFNDESAISGASFLGNSIYAFTGITALTDGTLFTLGTANSSQTPLPVSLISFSVMPIVGGVMIRWSTAMERNNAYFLIQRSKDAQLWTDVAQVNGAGNSVQTLSYNHNDPAAPGTYFYRLRQVDLDGRRSLSAVKRVVVSDLAPVKSAFYPVPADQFIFIRKDHLSAGWSLFSLDGRSISDEFQCTDNHGDYARCHTGHLPSGAYVLTTAMGQVFRIFIEHPR